MLTYKDKKRLIKQIRRELVEVENFEDLERIEKLIYILKISPRNEKTPEQWFNTYNEILELENRLIRAFVRLTVGENVKMIKGLVKEAKSKRANIPLSIKA